MEALDLVDDATISPGGVVVEGARGRVDATIESQLERLEKELLADRDEEPTLGLDSPSSDPLTEASLAGDSASGEPTIGESDPVGNERLESGSSGPPDSSEEDLLR